MRMLLGMVFFAAAMLFASPDLFSQTIEISRQNRTIEVVVTETVRVDADVANVTVGCIAYGETHDQAYQANLAIADKVIKALLSAGLPKGQIESSSLELSESNPGDDVGKTPASRKARQFKAHQSWKIRANASDAQRLIDLAVQAGANGVEDVSWDVADEESLVARARDAAMEKARKIAGDLAKSAGTKLGDLLFASNMANGLMYALANRTLMTSASTISAGGGNGFRPPSFSLTLFPEKVSRQATVRTVFAMD